MTAQTGVIAGASMLVDDAPVIEAQILGKATVTIGQACGALLHWGAPPSNEDAMLLSVRLADVPL